MTNTEFLKAFKDAIAKGDLDSDLDEIRNHIQLRRDKLSTLKFVTFNVGDKVKFNQKTRPEYMIGRHATVTDIKRSRVVVTLDSGPAGRFHGKITTSTDLLEKI